MTRLAVALATWFGCGFSPKAPGTIGSAAAALIAWASGWTGLSAAFAGALLFPLAVWSAGATATARGLKDPQIVVIDEVVGQWIAFAGVSAMSPWAAVAAFALFRVFDILKPTPVRQLEALPGGLGIVADDVFAGVYAAAVLYLAQYANII